MCTCLYVTMSHCQKWTNFNQIFPSKEAQKSGQYWEQCLMTTCTLDSLQLLPASWRLVLWHCLFLPCELWRYCEGGSQTNERWENWSCGKEYRDYKMMRLLKLTKNFCLSPSWSAMIADACYTEYSAKINRLNARITKHFQNFENNDQGQRLKVAMWRKIKCRCVSWMQIDRSL